MKFLRMILFVSVLLTLASPVLGQSGDCDIHPHPGVYSTALGNILGGMASEAYCNPPYNGGVPGNIQNAASWDGSTLGTQWKVSGMYINENGAVEISNTVDVYGNGQITYETNYLGGTFWLTGAHTWGDGTNDMTGTVNSYVVLATLTLVGGEVVAITSNVTFRGVFDDCSACYFEFVVANAMRVWQGDYVDLPADYPELLCTSGGEAFDVCGITLSIDCGVPAEEMTWGAVKQLQK